MTDVASILWPAHRAGEALAALGGVFRPQPEGPRFSPPEEILGLGSEALDRWVLETARRMGLEAEPVLCPYRDFERMVRQAGPALLRVRLHPSHPPSFVALVKCHARGGQVLAPDGSVRTVPRHSLTSALRAEIEQLNAPTVERILRQVEAHARLGDETRRALFANQLDQRELKVCWLIREPPRATWRGLLDEAGGKAGLATVLLLQGVQLALAAVAWWALGEGALSPGSLRGPWLWGWGITLLMLLVLQATTHAFAGRLAVTLSSGIRRTLLAGSLQAEVETLRQQGAGKLLGLLIEAQALDPMALTACLSLPAAVAQLCLALALLASGVGGAAHVLVLAAVAGFALVMARRYLEVRTLWTVERFNITGALLERMLGHRTRLVQEYRELRHRGEDEPLSRYVDASRQLDAIARRLTPLAAQASLFLGTAGLAPALLSGERNVEGLIVSVMGVFLGSHALNLLGHGVIQAAGCRLAWTLLQPLFPRGSEDTGLGDPAMAARVHPAERDDGALLSVRSLSFAYPGSPRPVLQDITFEVNSGERVLLEGSSGSGKSTLGSVLCALRQPGAGHVLLRGRALPALGTAGWRRRVASVPQFQDNYIFGMPLSFNLLMGHHWRPTPDDVREAEEVCRELGLGPLIDRMPLGLGEILGESGWQLSHGERTRVYIARALLQGAELVILDESLAGLDPASLETVVECLRRRAKTLIVIAHP